MVYIDVHCHSSSKAFMSGIGAEDNNVFDSFYFNIEHPVYRLLRTPIENRSHVRLVSQSNFDHLYEGGVRVAFVSITPMEKAFAVLNPLAAGLTNDLIRLFLQERSNYRDGFLSSYAINALTGYKVSDIDYIKNEAYTIYEDLFLKEFTFLTSFENQVSPDGRYVVRFPRKYAELKTNLEDDRNLNILITVEGAHSFGRTRPLPDIQNNVRNTHVPDTHNVAYGNEIAANLQHLRTHHDIPVFSIGLCHHFWNGLAGHARSLATLIEAVVNQDEGINAPLLDNGRLVLEAMSLTANGNDSVSPILADIKHMSPQ